MEENWKEQSQIDVHKKDEILAMKCMPGWKYPENWLKNKEKKLFRALMRVSEDKIKTVRAKIQILEEFKKYLDIEIEDGVEAQQILEEYGE